MIVLTLNIAIFVQALIFLNLRRPSEVPLGDMFVAAARQLVNKILDFEEKPDGG